MGKDRQTLFIVANMWSMFGWYTGSIQIWILAITLWFILAQIYVRDWMRMRRLKDKVVYNIKEVIKDAETTARRNVPKRTDHGKKRNINSSIQESEQRNKSESP